MDDDPISFVVEDHVPWEEIDNILDGHSFRQIDRSTKEQAILASLEEEGAIIITASRWFFNELRRTASQDKRRYKRAGVVLIPGRWANAAPLLEYWMPLIELVCAMRRNEADNRVVVELKITGVAAVDP